MSRRTKKRFEYLLWTLGVLFLGYVGFVLINGQLEQYRASKDLDRVLNSKQIEIIPRKAPAMPAPPYGELVGRLEIPRLNISVITFEGTDAPVLKKGVGHLTGSALPGYGGNVVLAAHRDTYFRKLKDIREGDEITVTTPQRSARYIVDHTKIIDPTQSEVLNATASPTLTLITCYPFYFVGHAPKRFVVVARPAPGSDLPKTVVADAKPSPAKAISAPASEFRTIAASKPKTAQLTWDESVQKEEPRPEPRKTASVPRSTAARQSVPEDNSVAETAATHTPTLIELPQDAPPQAKRSWNPTRLISKLNFFGKKKQHSQSALAETQGSH